MDIFFTIIGLLFCVIGIIGSFIPIIPGPVTSWFGLLLLHLTSFVPFEIYFLIGSFLIAITVFILDLIIPVIGLKKLGGTKKGIIGATIGLIIGFFLGPIGLLTGPFIGAFSGELLNNINYKKAIKASLGTLIGFFVGMTMKFTVSFVFLIIYIQKALSFGNLI